MNWEEYYSHGKLLISGEYLILDGASGLAIPTKYGQKLRVRPNDSGFLSWTSLDQNGAAWYREKFDLKWLLPLTSDKPSPDSSQLSLRLSELLRAAKELNPAFLQSASGLEVESRLEFNRDWGLGSSSTLLSNLARWADIDPFQLSELTFGGSGYDVACARSSTPILYQRKNGLADIRQISFNPSFSNQLFFVHLNKKMDSRDAINRYRQTKFDVSSVISNISDLSEEMVRCSNLKRFQLLMEKHESILAKILDQEPVKNLLFPDFPGAVKSLGAWGGDFVLTASEYEIIPYFKERDYFTIIPFNEMILQ